ncbi:hypothetical protein BU204_17955 [Actinophytocola xanthii]|uniref:Uncharacterized protein n=1 Tax=Actinophytocola xanthii TaxID=1912961 RepID=A0A1Q8CPI3_9PSEU|nr:hypothetical protein BU204_17955 [Actinophytocola xanthii]
MTRIKGRTLPYRAVVSGLGRPGRFTFGDAACALLAVGALGDPDVERLVRFLPAHTGVRRQQVLNRLAVGDLTGAGAAADRIADGLSWLGHRDVGAVLAARGDAEGFFAGWRRYAASQDRQGMAELKQHLVAGVAHRDGWRAALAVTRDRRIGPALARFAFQPFLAGDVEGLRHLLAGDAAGILTETDELSLLAGAVRAASGHNPEHDHPLLGEIVDRIIAVDPTTDKATMRWRDGALFGLWPAYGDQATLDRVRAAVRTPRYRRELTTLAREVVVKPNAR